MNYLLLLWILITVFLGASHYTGNFLASYHPYWALLTLIPALWLLKKSAADTREIYLPLMGFVLAALTGIASQMGFLSSFFHQLIVWPIFFIFGSKLIRQMLS